MGLFKKMFSSEQSKAKSKNKEIIDFQRVCRFIYFNPSIAQAYYKDLDDVGKFKKAIRGNGQSDHEIKEKMNELVDLIKTELEVKSGEKYNNAVNYFGRLGLAEEDIITVLDACKKIIESNKVYTLDEVDQINEILGVDVIYIMMRRNEIIEV